MKFNLFLASALLPVATILVTPDSASAFGVVLGNPPVAGYTGVTTNMGTNAGNINNIINESGLSTGYTSLVTDYDAYTDPTTGATHDSSVAGNEWSSANGTTTGWITFSFDRAYSIYSTALWQGRAANTNRQIQNFTVYADTNNDFTDGGLTQLGSFTASLSPVNPFSAQRFDFSSISTQYVHFQVTSNYGANRTSLGEVVFAVPEPMTMLGAFGAAGLGAFFKRHSNRKA